MVFEEKLVKQIEILIHVNSKEWILYAGYGVYKAILISGSNLLR